MIKSCTSTSSSDIELSSMIKSDNLKDKRNQLGTRIGDGECNGEKSKWADAIDNAIQLQEVINQRT